MILPLRAIHRGIVPHPRLGPPRVESGLRAALTPWLAACSWLMRLTRGGLWRRKAWSMISQLWWSASTPSPSEPQHRLAPSFYQHCPIQQAPHLELRRGCPIQWPSVQGLASMILGSRVTGPLAAAIAEYKASGQGIGCNEAEGPVSTPPDMTTPSAVVPGVQVV